MNIRTVHDYYGLCLFYFLLTTFCRKRSNLSHFNRVTSSRSPSFVGPAALPGLSWHTLHDLAPVSALDIDSKPVSLSTYAPPAKCSKSSLVNELSSLASDSACVLSGACAVRSIRLSATHLPHKPL